MRTALLWILMILCGGAVVAEEKKMNEKIREKIIQAVHKEHGWKTNEVRVDEVERLKQGNCSFYAARHTVRPISYVLNYAVLNGDVVLSGGDEKALPRILQACGGDASAGWWAEVITEFHPDLGSGVVLHDATQNRGAVEKIEAAKKDFAAPAFGSAGGSKTVTFFLLEPESYVVYSVQATVEKDGTVSITRTEIG